MTVPASSLRFAYEWERGDGVAAPELAATWARIEMWVNDDCVTQVEDAQTGSARRSIYAPLYPIAEWIAFNWWLLKANVRPAAFITSEAKIPRYESAAWMPHHNLRGAGDGFVWPNLLILPEGLSTRLVWHPDHGSRAATPVRYLAGGEAVLANDAAEQVLADLVESVLARLDERRIASPLGLEWQAILDADVEEREFCVAAARLGLDPYAIDADLGDLVLDAAGRLSENLLQDFLDAVSINKISSGLNWVDKGSDLIDGLEIDPSPQLSELRVEVGGRAPAAEETAWATGYSRARLVRNFVGLAPQDVFDFADMVHVERRLHDDQALQGLGGLTTTGAAALVLRRRYKKPVARFSTARALWHLVQDSTPQRFLLTTAHADRQRSERAFAAELLAPANGVEQLLPDLGGIVTAEDVEDVAGHFAVSPLVIRHQIENQLALQVA